MKDEEEPNQIFETSTVTVTSAEKATKEEVGDRLERPQIQCPNIRSKSEA